MTDPKPLTNKDRIAYDGTKFHAYPEEKVLAAKQWLKKEDEAIIDSLIKFIENKSLRKSQSSAEIRIYESFYEHIERLQSKLNAKRNEEYNIK